MGLLDGLLGGGAAGGSPLQSLVLSMLSSQGGQAAAGQVIGGLLGSGAAGGAIQSLVSAFEQNGLGHLPQSWIGTGPNQPVSPGQVQQVFGDDQVQAMAQQTGMAPQDLVGRIAQMLPGLVDRLTPDGRMPPSSGGTADL